MDEQTLIASRSEAGLMLFATDAVRRFEAVGSSTIRDVTPNDVDILVLVENRQGEDVLADFVEDLFPGYKLCMHEYADWEDHWAALRKGDINLIVTTDEEWFEKSKAANRVIQLLNLTEKKDRIAVFRVVRDDAEVHTARAAGELACTPASE